MVAVLQSSVFPNNNPPRYITGSSYISSAYKGTGASVTMATGVDYFFPFAVWANVTFSAAQFFNSGVGDNTKNVRIALYKDDGATGGPGTLVTDFGAVTLTGASALRTATASAICSPGMYWGAIASDSNPVIYGMNTFLFASDVGYLPTSTQIEQYIGLITPIAPANLASVQCLKNGRAYASFPSTATAPTSSTTPGGGNTPAVPAVWFKV